MLAFGGRIGQILGQIRRFLLLILWRVARAFLFRFVVPSVVIQQILAKGDIKYPRVTSVSEVRTVITLLIHGPSLAS